MADVTINDDYASMSIGSTRFYYGYEVTDKEDNWCFQASFNYELITIPKTELKVDDEWNCAECLLAGIALLVDRGVLIQGRK